MRKLFTAVFFGLFAAVGAGAGPASAEDGVATFYFTNSAPNIIVLKAYSETRNWVWPGANSYWVLDDNSQQYYASLACRVGEKICFGGSYSPSDTPFYWGVGFQGNKSCASCCLICGPASANVWHAWDLTGGWPNTCASCNDGSCQCGNNSPGGLCSNHGGNNPSVGCTQQ